MTKTIRGTKKIKEEKILKEKIIIALVVAIKAVAFSSCKMGGEDNSTSSTPGTNNTSSVVSGNIPSDNEDGEYDNDTSSNNNSGSLGSDISSFVSSGEDMISSMLK